LSVFLGDSGGGDRDLSNDFLGLFDLGFIIEFSILVLFVLANHLFDLACFLNC